MMMRIDQRFNTTCLAILAASVFGIHVLMYFVVTLRGLILPMGNLAFALSIYIPLVFLVWKNQWLSHVSANRWIICFVCYLSLSFLYGLKRYGTPSIAIFDLLFFLYISIIILIPPFSFNVKTFDRILAIGVVISCISMVVMLGLKPIVLHDRVEFSFYMAPLRFIGAGAGYLLLKNARRVNIFTYVGLVGVLEAAVIYGLVGAFRGQMLLSVLWVVLFTFIQVRTINSQFGLKVFSFLMLGAGLSIVIAVSMLLYREQLYVLAERFFNLFLSYEKTGDLASSDARLGEMQYFMQINSNWKLILGHGVGGLWYDFYGMFGEASGGTFAGARTMLHINWLHVIFKIGVVGFGLMLCMLVRHYRQIKMLIRGNYGWWAFLIWYCAFTTYYGHKSLNLESIVFLMVLVHPWLFLSPDAGNVVQHPRGMRPARS